MSIHHKPISKFLSANIQNQLNNVMDNEIAYMLEYIKTIEEKIIQIVDHLDKEKINPKL